MSTEICPAVQLDHQMRRCLEMLAMMIHLATRIEVRGPSSCDLLNVRNSSTNKNLITAGL